MPALSQGSACQVHEIKSKKVWTLRSALRSLVWKGGFRHQEGNSGRHKGTQVSNRQAFREPKLGLLVKTGVELCETRKGSHRLGFRAWFHNFLVMLAKMKSHDISPWLPLNLTFAMLDGSTGPISWEASPHPTGPCQATPVFPHQHCSFATFKGN